MLSVWFVSDWSSVQTTVLLLIFERVLKCNQVISEIYLFIYFWRAKL